MLVLGITGGIGSGKSRVLYEIGDNYNSYICETDRLAHKLMNEKKLKKSLCEAFGTEILNTEEDSIDRSKLGSIVFNDERKLEQLNMLVHPAVKEYILRDIEEKKEKYDIYVIEAALLIQDGYDRICDEIWYVWASRETRIKRLMEYRGYSLERCEEVMANQPDDDFFEKYTNFTINNDLDYQNSSKQLKHRLNNMGINAIINACGR